jgi:hypothetical protein
MYSSKQGFNPKKPGALLLAAFYLFITATYLCLVPKLTSGIDRAHHFVLKQRTDHGLVIQRADKSTVEENRLFKHSITNVPGHSDRTDLYTAKSFCRNIIYPGSRHTYCNYYYLLNCTFRI